MAIVFMYINIFEYVQIEYIESFWCDIHGSARDRYIKRNPSPLILNQISRSIARPKHWFLSVYQTENVYRA